MAGARELARTAFDEQSWAQACSAFLAADHEAPLPGEDLERLGVAAFLVGRADESDRAWERAHRAWLGEGDVTRAARCAFWLAYGLLDRGEMTRGAGWLARARRLLEESGRDCAERGYLLIPVALQAMAQGDAEAAAAQFEKALAVGSRFGDRDLVALSLTGRGQSLIQLGDHAAGVSLLDEVMVAVTTGEVSPPVAGRVYCAVIDSCLEVLDVRRAQDWTDALAGWCKPQTDLVQFAGVCLLHLSELHQLRGDWAGAIGESQRACERLSGGHFAAGAAHYQQAELHRVRGELELAAAAYARASQCGRDPQPGLARMRLAQGDVGAAVAAIQGVDAVPDAWPTPAGQAPHWRRRLRRMRATWPEILAARVEILLAAGDIDTARRAADELADVAATRPTSLLRALASRAQGAVHLALGEATLAIQSLRESCVEWHELQAPYEAARTQALLAMACTMRGDDVSAGLERDAARRVFAELGAVPDLGGEAALAASRRASAKGLTDRQIEVLGLVAAGKTNREIAEELVLSDHTVRRHMQNIFTKLGVPSRAAAAAFAVRRRLV